jgi:predicted RNA-binding Zn ribbon-like protein
VTSQIYLDSYVDAGVLTAMAFANELLGENVDAYETAARILSFDPPSLALLRRKHGSELVALARRLRRVFEQLDAEDVDSAVAEINRMLELHPAHPHLAKEDGIWRLHHHPGDADLVPMYTSICAEGLARMIGGGYASRFGVCEADGCDKVFFDNSKNGTRRFCSVTCQNRIKTAAFRSRRQALTRRKR